MKLPTLSEESVTGLVFSLILVLDGKGILKRADFTAGLGEVVQKLKSADFLSPHVARELSDFHSYLLELTPKH